MSRPLHQEQAEERQDSTQRWLGESWQAILDLIMYTMVRLDSRLMHAIQ